MKPVDITGNTYGVLTAIERTEKKSSSGSYLWKFKCICGNEHITSVAAINQRINSQKENNSVSCGCRMENIRIESGKQRKKHGYLSNNEKHPLYNVYNAMLTRCYNTKSKSYKHYGAKGVYVCEEWLHHPEIFIKWCLENGWNKGKEIDKDIKVPGNLCYSPETCLIVSKQQNAYKAHSREHAFNKKASIKLSQDNVEKIIEIYKFTSASQQDIAKTFNVSRSCIQRILNINNTTKLIS